MTTTRNTIPLGFVGSQDPIWEPETEPETEPEAESETEPEDVAPGRAFTVEFGQIVHLRGKFSTKSEAEYARIVYYERKIINRAAVVFAAPRNERPLKFEVLVLDELDPGRQVDIPYFVVVTSRGEGRGLRSEARSHPYFSVLDAFKDLSEFLDGVCPPETSRRTPSPTYCPERRIRQRDMNRQTGGMRIMRAGNPSRHRTGELRNFATRIPADPSYREVVINPTFEPEEM